MRPTAPQFYSQLELPCTVSQGERGERKLAGTVFRIESARLILRINTKKHGLLRLGEEVRLKVHLPAEGGISAKDLTLRGRVMVISDSEGRAQTYVLSFRRAQFTDRVEAPAGWEM